MAERDPEAEELTAAIHTRRLRKCIAEGSHTDHCQRCGLE